MVKKNNSGTWNALTDSRVAVTRVSEACYPEKPPFNPGRNYPEWDDAPIDATNKVYGAVRELFCLLGLDAANFGAAGWNPLGEIIRPGDTVLLKPNLIAESHKYHSEEWQQIITHPAVVRAVLDYVLLALKGKGKAIVADGPQYDSNWDLIVGRSGLLAVVEAARQRSQVPIELLDLRDYWQDLRGDVIYRRVPLPGDPQGGTEIDLGQASEFVGHQGAGRYYGSDYFQEETNYYHSSGRHVYKICATAANADVLINLPKMKTHSKVGVTLSLKNLVGINAGRNYLPHHTDGTPETGGDQFPERSFCSVSERIGIRWFQRQSLRFPKVAAPIYRLAKKICTPIYGETEKVVRSGNWYGNDTAWRMVLDINKVLMYSNGKEFPAEKPKRFLSIIDGVIAGDGEGPVCPEPLPAGVLLAGFNPLAVDCAAAHLMGFDVDLIPMLVRGFHIKDLPIANFSFKQIRILSQIAAWNNILQDIPLTSCLHFKATSGWAGHIERQQREKA